MTPWTISLPIIHFECFLVLESFVCIFHMITTIKNNQLYQLVTFLQQLKLITKIVSMNYRRHYMQVYIERGK